MESGNRKYKIVVTGTRGIPNIMGGVETHCENLYPYIVQAGYDVTVVRRSCYLQAQQKTREYKGIHLKDIYAPRKKSLEAIIHTILAVLYAKKAKAEDRPGVTLDKQWVSTGTGIDLLDMPGILWPKFEDKEVGENLAFTGAVKDSIMDIEYLAMRLCAKLRVLYPDLLCQRYRLGDISEYDEFDDYDLLCTIGKKRGFLVSGGEVDTVRTSNVLLDEFRSARIGRITLDRTEACKEKRG